MPSAPLPPELERFLQAPRAAVMGTVGADGAPATAATWFEYRDGLLWFTMRSNARRVEDMRRNPSLALTVLADDWRIHLSLVARVVEIADDPELEVADRLSQLYDGEPYAYGSRDAGFTAVSAEIYHWHTWGELEDFGPCEPPTR